MPTESQIMEKVHAIDRTQGEHGVKIDNLESWVEDIHKTLKGLESKVTLFSGALIGIQIAIQFAFQIWGK